MRRVTQGIFTFKMDLNFPITCIYDRNATLNDVVIDVEEETTGTYITVFRGSKWGGGGGGGSTFRLSVKISLLCGCPLKFSTFVGFR